MTRLFFQDGPHHVRTLTVRAAAKPAKRRKAADLAAVDAAHAERDQAIARNRELNRIARAYWDKRTAGAA